MTDDIKVIKTELKKVFSYPSEILKWYLLWIIR